MTTTNRPLAGYGHWNQQVFVEIGKQIHPYKQLDCFRDRTVGYTGDLSFWKTPSPEPQIGDETRTALIDSIEASTTDLVHAVSCLAGRLRSVYEPSELLFVSILRAGVPIAEWLTELLPGSQAVTASLFVGVGIDVAALTQINRQFPNRKIVFVDGWTGKGGVAGVIADLNTGRNWGPLAVLIDPWNLADFSGTDRDILCPSALFTGPTTLGFSRSFVQADGQLFGAYQFPETLLDTDLIRRWRDCVADVEIESVADLVVDRRRFVADTPLRIHANEVCRALINSNPAELMFRQSPAEVKSRYELLLILADQQGIPCRFDCTKLNSLRTSVACELNLKSHT